MKDLSVAVQAEIAAGKCAPIILAAIEFTSGTSYLWTGYGDLSFDGHTWKGLGTMCGVSAIQESNSVQADNVTLTLNGIPTGLISQALGEVSESYSVQVFLGFLSDSGALVVDPVPCFSGLMDVPTIQEGADTSSISITAENLLVALQRASARRYTHADQQIGVAGDLGFNYVPSIQTWNGIWGKAGTASPSKSGNVTSTHNGPQLLKPYGFGA